MNASSDLTAQRILSDPGARLALEIISRLVDNGFVAYLAGGCVRDALLGRSPKDYDVATDARPEQIRELFGHRRTLPIGVAFGVISVMGDKRSGQEPVEVATFRSDGPYTDGRRPDTVHFSSPAEDAARRDFTINGLFFDPGSNQMIDFVGGQFDIQQRLIRAIGDPVARFHEDKLRLLRAVRFATTYGFTLEGATRRAIIEHASSVVLCSGERIGAEMRRLVQCRQASRGIELLVDCELSSAVMPHIGQALQSPDARSQLEERLDRTESLELAPRLAILALAAGELSVEALRDLVECWKLSNAEAEAARVAMELHQRLLRAESLRWSELQPLLVHRYAGAALDLARGLADEVPGADRSLSRVDRALALPPQELDPPPLLSGQDLIRLGLPPGPAFKTMLERLRAAQLDGHLRTRPEAERAVLAGTIP